MKLSIASRLRASAGFTLVELMTTVLIAAILIAIGGPMYTNQIRHSRRTEARTALLDLASREERFYSTNSAYTNSGTNLGYAGAAVPWPVNVGSNYYQIYACVGATVAGITAPCTGAAAATGAAFVLVAVPINAQTKDTTCGSFLLDNTGVQTVSGTATAQTCWSQ